MFKAVRVGQRKKRAISYKELKERSRVTKEEWREFTKTVWHIANVKHENHPAVFPKEIPHRLIKLFTFWNETVLDPFAGIGTTAIAALENGRNAYCIDQNPDYIKTIKDNIVKLKSQATLKQFQEKTRPPYVDVETVIKLGDSKKLLSEMEENSIALIVTSPPYWNKADYGNRSENLGNIERYSDFFKEIRPIFEECYRVLMPGRKICIVTANVNQYTDHGLLTFPLATDFTNILRGIGFDMINEIIWSKDATGGKWGSWGNQRPIFGSYPYPPNFLFKNVHEYVLIFAKPDGAVKNGKKVKRLKDIL